VNSRIGEKLIDIAMVAGMVLVVVGFLVMWGLANQSGYEGCRDNPDRSGCMGDNTWMGDPAPGDGYPADDDG
jgi:hypothetical protein